MKRTQTALLLLICFSLGFGCFFPLFTKQSIVEASHSDWYGTSWTYREKITIDHTKIAATLTNFPIYITTASLDGSKVQDNGNDILITSSDGRTKLSHEIESYSENQGLGMLNAWVKVPSVSSATNTILYLYYGNAGCASQQAATSVWDANYKAVYHLNSNGADSTSNGNTGTASGASATTGITANGFTFDGANDYIEVSDSNSLDLTSGYTIEAWMKPTNVFSTSENTTMGIVDKGAYNLFLDQSSGKIASELINNSGATWSKVYDTSDKGMNAFTVYNGKIYVGWGIVGKVTSSATGNVGSWSTEIDKNNEWIWAMAVYKGNLYVGLGAGGGTDRGDIWAYNAGNSTWWCAYNYGGTNYYIMSMCVFNGKLYYTRGEGTPATIYYYDGTTWEQTAYSGQADAQAWYLCRYNGKLYAGEGYAANKGDVYSTSDGTTWAIDYNSAYSRAAGKTTYQHLLMYGMGWAVGSNDITKYDGSTWTALFRNGATEYGCGAIGSYAGKLYAQDGGNDNGNDIFVYDGVSTWSKDFEMPGSECHTDLTTFDGDLYAGNVHDVNDADIYRKDGGNGVQGTTTSWAAGTWAYVSATYDQSNIRIYKNGAQETSEAYAPAIETNVFNMYIGELIGGRADGLGQHNFKGILDEIRISATARNSSWLSSTYNEIISPGSFETFGSEEGAPTWIQMLTGYSTFGNAATFTTATSGYDTFSNSASYLTITSGWSTFSETSSSFKQLLSGWSSFANIVSFSTIDYGYSLFSNSSSFLSIESGWNTFNDISPWAVYDITGGWNSFGNLSSYLTIASGYSTLDNNSAFSSVVSGWSTFSNVPTWIGSDSGWSTFQGASAWLTIDHGYSLFTNVSIFQNLTQGYSTFVYGRSWLSDMGHGYHTFRNISHWKTADHGWSTFQNTSYTVVLDLYPSNNDTVAIGSFSFAAQVEDTYGRHMNVTWYIPVNGTWTQFGGAFQNVTNGTYYKSPGSQFDLYNHTYQYKVTVDSYGGGSMSQIITFTTATINASGLISIPMMALIILIFLWVFMLILAEWKNDPFYGIVCGVIGFVIIPAFWYSINILEANLAFTAVWGFLQGYILIMNLAQAINVAAGRDSNKPK